MGFQSWVAVVIIMVSSTGLLISRDWRWRLSLLAVLHFGIFSMTIQYWPLGLAAIKLITGWMGCVILGMTRITTGVRLPEEVSWPQGRAFRLLAASLVVAATASIAPDLSSRLSIITLPVAWGGILSIGMGLIHLGMTSQHSRVIVALLTILAGFELLYAAVEGSILVAAMLATVDIGLALVGAYMLSISASTGGKQP